MGEKSKRRARFLAEHPVCCYCGSEATTEDHCPARICFRDRIGPDGWSFPACAACNSAISKTEQVVAFYIRALDFTDENMRTADLQRLLQGVTNNNPDLVPRINAGANEKRRMLAHLGVRRPPGEFLEDVPIMAVPVGAGAHLDFFNRKLSAAIYYRITGEIITPGHLVMSRWMQTQDDTLEEILKTLGPAWTESFQGARTNLDFGDQLSGVVAAGLLPQVLTYVVQFGTSLCFWGGVGLPREDAEEAHWRPYRPMSAGI